MLPRYRYSDCLLLTHFFPLPPDTLQSTYLWAWWWCTFSCAPSTRWPTYTAWQPSCSSRAARSPTRTRTASPLWKMGTPLPRSGPRTTPSATGDMFSRETKIHDWMGSFDFSGKICSYSMNFQRKLCILGTFPPHPPCQSMVFMFVFSVLLLLLQQFEILTVTFSWWWFWAKCFGGLTLLSCTLMLTF